MKNNKTGEKRIKKVVTDNVNNATCEDFYYGSDWTWAGSEPWCNICKSVEYIGNGYYRKK